MESSLYYCRSKSFGILSVHLAKEDFTWAHLFAYNGRVSTKNIYLMTAIIVMGLCLGWGGSFLFQFNDESIKNPVASAPPPANILPSIEELYPYVIPPKSTLGSVLREMDISPQVIHQVVEAAKPINDLGRIKPGTRFSLFYANPKDDGSEVTGIKFRFSPMEMLEVHKIGDQWKAQKITEVVETRVMTFSGIVKSSLWESAAEAKMDPNLIADLAEVFAWQMDFSREVQQDDRWRLSVEQKMVKGQPVGWGSILAAEYENATQKFVGILYRVSENQSGYYSPDGQNLRRMFLKSPIRYGRISSRFSTKRFHPILQYNRPHLGVDFAAPIGTPIRAVGDGIVAEEGVRGGAGKMIRIRHNSEYATAYKHLSGFAKGVHSGGRVQQGQIIGYVGNTGLSTGPHLHFEFFQNGRYVDPLGKKFPSAEPIPQDHLAQFKTEVTTMMASLPNWSGDKFGRSGNLPPQTQPTGM
jgi:murein DD-endopeptidase MepM/ murein hydrolase activator NlpD